MFHHERDDVSIATVIHYALTMIQTFHRW